MKLQEWVMREHGGYDPLSRWHEVKKTNNEPPKPTLVERVKNWLIKRGWLKAPVPPRDTTFDSLVPEAEKIEAGEFPEPLVHDNEKRIREITEMVLADHEKSGGGPIVDYKNLVKPRVRTEPVVGPTVERQKEIVDLLKRAEEGTLLESER